MATSEAQKRATTKYIKENLQEIRFRVKNEQAEQIRQYASSQGKSVRAYIVDLIEQDMKAGTEAPPTQNQE